MKKRVAVIGATGSVGSSVLDVCRGNKDRLEVTALAAGRDAGKLALLAGEFGASVLCLSDKDASAALAEKTSARVLQGADGLEDISQDPDIDHVVFASSGTAAIKALQCALKAGKEVSLANKESIVVAGEWVMPLVRGDQLRPLDSEHNAIWQCLHGEAEKPRGIYLTASGGPFRGCTPGELESVTPEMALKHPVWSMGAKITIDSATLMNKGIELIEAMFLFGLKHRQVDAIVSPGSFVHGLVEFMDGSVKMLAGDPDMRLPAASCLFWPERLPPMPDYARPVLFPRTISFEMADEKRFPALRLAKEAAARGGAYPALLVGADETAVDLFLKKKISFTSIPQVVEDTIESYSGPAPRSVDEAIEIIEWAARAARNIAS